MRLSVLIPVLLSLGLLAVGCGWSPPGSPPPEPDTCAPTDGPAPDTVTAEIDSLPPSAGGQQWQETARGHTADCQLYWVQVSQTSEAPDAPQQVLFFNKNTPLGPATPEPRPYINVLSSGDDTVIVQYQWRQGTDEPCCPTGIGTVRFQLGDDGELKPIDEIPNQ